MPSPTPITGGRRRGRKPLWKPAMGEIVRYIGTSRRLSTQGHTAKVVAMALSGRLVIEVLGRSGAVVRTSVKPKSLAPLGPSLF